MRLTFGAGACCYTGSIIVTLHLLRPHVRQERRQLHGGCCQRGCILRQVFLAGQRGRCHGSQLTRVAYTQAAGVSA